MKTENKLNVDDVYELKSLLLVLNHSRNTVGIVEGVDKNGNVKVSSVADNNSDLMISIDSSEDSFTSFYSNFYHQLKDPESFSFFKVTEYEARQAAEDLQQYINSASEEEKQKLKEYEVSIDVVESYCGKNSSQKIKTDIHKSRYLYDANQIDWEMMKKAGLTKDLLTEIGALEPLLKGYKTPMLVPISLHLKSTISQMEARLSLRPNTRGVLEVCFHPIRKQYDFSRPFYGHTFTQEDQSNLIENGNMGRVVDLISPITGEKIPSLISKDKLTNELISLRAEFVRIPLVIKGVTLNEAQKKILKEGKPLYIKNMLSKRGTLFNATVQFNADHQYVEFLFRKNIRSLKLNDLTTKLREEIPTKFRGVKLKSWQIDKLKKGETTYINGLTDKSGKKYQGYITFDKTTRKFNFSFINPKKEIRKNNY
ncbi:MAG: DUF3945 domain-containing protein [Chryseobacterium culicis]